ncbi:unnamed protein product [Cuscuta campestris]|uniref:Uncharacterized protein n=1 Tax=Cuscuta campestris TaxID=132261 RepID=A0A484M0D1_9ASTE|nr:unnamed protein product [Cuscuta campestris]
MLCTFLMTLEGMIKSWLQKTNLSHSFSPILNADIGLPRYLIGRSPGGRFVNLSSIPWLSFFDECSLVLADYLWSCRFEKLKEDIGSRLNEIQA